jgi:hypothetical protein
VPLQGEPSRIGGDHRLRDRTGEAVGLGERRPAPQRADDVDPPRAGDHRVGGEPRVAQSRSGLPSGSADRGEADPGCRIEIDDQAVGLARGVGPRQPGVRGDDVLADEVDERRRIIGDDVCDRAPAFVDGGPPDPLGEVGGGGLHEESAPLDAAGERLQGQWPVADERHHRLGHRLVVAGQFELGDRRVVEQRLVGVGERHVAPTDPHRRGARGSSPGAAVIPRGSHTPGPTAR